MTPEEPGHDKREEETSAEYDEGFEAGKKGFGKDQNPEMPGGQEYRDWLQGWRAAQEK